MGTSTVSRMLIRSVVAVFAPAVRPGRPAQPSSSLTRCAFIRPPLNRHRNYGYVAGRDQQSPAEHDVTPTAALGRAACRMVADIRRATGFQGRGLRPLRSSPEAHRLPRAPAEHSPPLE